ncbi:MAG: hypothetical protein H6595_13270 [Flavobacteriales bacterium]|nr:hypothetical protein [Flavobacteriales bacterium]MCB9168436.1 hypothetical protein [Flavobacteriales bacterium]
MREFMLIVHFIGLAMGLGTSFAMMFLGIAAGRMEAEKRKEFMLNVGVLSRMGHIGLLLLVITGGYLMTPYLGMIGDMPLFIAKLVLVVALGALVGVMSARLRKARKGDFDAQMRVMPILGRLGLLTTLTIVVLAVLSFH